MEVVDGDGGMQCARHPFKNSTPAGGICAFCLQEKLGKIFSSSYAVSVFPSSSSSSSSSPSSRSTHAATGGGGNAHRHHHSRKSRLPFVSNKKSRDERNSDMVFKRSKSSATPVRNIYFFNDKYVEDYSSNHRSFWKFLHLSKHPTSRKSEKHVKKSQLFVSHRSRIKRGREKDGGFDGGG